MINKAGEKIKALRKAHKMTQSELAGNELTKSMLSQIENNISNPSFKTLQYLADRLEKPVSYFLEENYVESGKQDRSAYEDTVILTEINRLIDSDQLELAQKQLADVPENNLTGFINKKTYADLLLKLGSKLNSSGRIEESRACLNKSIKQYVSANLYVEAAKAHVELAFSFYRQFDYQECLKLSEKAFELYDKEINKEPLFEIELYYYKILVLFAVGDMKSASDAISKTIELSSRTSVYFKTGELYRLNAIFNYLSSDRELYRVNLDKSKQYAEFTEDNVCIAKIYTVEAYFSLEENNWERALEYSEKIKFCLGRETYIYHLVRGRALFQAGSCRQAYESIVKVDYPSGEAHRFDYLNMWSAKVYEGLILNKLGRYAEAVEAVKYGIEKMSIFKESKFLLNAYKALSDIYSEAGDFKNAFTTLKIANELQEKVNNGSILF